MKRFGLVIALMTVFGGTARGQGVTITPAPALSLLARGGTVAVKVADYGAAQEQVRALAATQGAVLLGVKTSVNGKGRKHGLLRFSVPQASLPRLLPPVRAVGTLYSESVAASDNRSEYEELARRVMRLQQHEARLTGVLESPRRMRGSDILYLQERLFRASVDESLLTQQRVDLVRSAQESLLTVELFEPGTLPAPPADRLDLGRRYAGAVGLARGLWNAQTARAATAAAYLAVFAPLWVPALVVSLLLLLWLWRSRRRIAAGALSLIEGAIGVVGWLRARWDGRHGPRGFSEPIP